MWDPSIGFGQPLLADPGAQVAYPGTFLALLAPRPLAYTVFVLAHLVLTAVGTRRLAAASCAARAPAPCSPWPPQALSRRSRGPRKRAR